MTDDDILAFARSMRSIWTVELLLRLAGSADRWWSRQELVGELRASSSVVSQGIDALSRSGLVSESDGRFNYAPRDGALHELVTELGRLYRARPLAVTQAMFGESPAVARFSDAFRIRREEE